jgi:hypothetical protein
VQHDAILRALRDAATAGLTAEQIERVTGLPGSSVRPRLVELRGNARRWTGRDRAPRWADSPPVDAPEKRTRKTDSGRPAQVYVITPAGLGHLQEEKA